MASNKSIHKDLEYLGPVVSPNGRTVQGLIRYRCTKCGYVGIGKETTLKTEGNEHCTVCKKVNRKNIIKGKTSYSNGSGTNKFVVTDYYSEPMANWDDRTIVKLTCTRCGYVKRMELDELSSNSVIYCPICTSGKYNKVPKQQLKDAAAQKSEDDAKTPKVAKMRYTFANKDIKTDKDGCIDIAKITDPRLVENSKKYWIPVAEIKDNPDFILAKCRLCQNIEILSKIQYLKNTTKCGCLKLSISEARRLNTNNYEGAIYNGLRVTEKLNDDKSFVPMYKVKCMYCESVFTAPINKLINGEIKCSRCLASEKYTTIESTCGICGNVNSFNVRNSLLAAGGNILREKSPICNKCKAKIDLSTDREYSYKKQSHDTLVDKFKGLARERTFDTTTNIMVLNPVYLGNRKTNDECDTEGNFIVDGLYALYHHRRVYYNCFCIEHMHGFVASLYDVLTINRLESKDAHKYCTEDRKNSSLKNSSRCNMMIKSSFANLHKDKKK